MNGDFSIGQRVRIIMQIPGDSPRLIGKTGEIVKESDPMSFGTVDSARKSGGWPKSDNKLRFWLVKLDETGETVNCPGDMLELLLE